MKHYLIYSLLLYSFNVLLGQSIVPYGDNKEVGKYININGVQHYYEVYGTGKPVLVMSCDRDVIKEEHTFFIYKNIPFANLCILPIETH